MRTAIFHGIYSQRCIASRRGLEHNFERVSATNIRRERERFTNELTLLYALEKTALLVRPRLPVVRDNHHHSAVLVCSLCIP